MEPAFDVNVLPHRLPEEALCEVAGPDYLLIGALRLLTEFVDADAELAGDLGIPSSATSAACPLMSPRAADAGVRAAGLVPFLLHTCLLAPMEQEVQDCTPPGTEAFGRSARLVPSPRTPGPLCQTELSRQAALDCLLALVRCSVRNAALLMRLLTLQLHGWLNEPSSALTLPSAWRVDPNDRELVSPVGYVGLRNLGCICYMNALMQQFFMMEPFRYGLLSLRDAEGMPVAEQADSVLYQLQRMFGFLDSSQRIHYDPASWCFSFKDWDGQPTNVLIQQDAQEYLTSLLDRIEFAVSRGPRVGMVQQLLGIETREVRCCQGGCGRVRVTSEPAVCLSAPLVGGNLDTSLRRTTEWEDIANYQCDDCNKRTTLRKRQALGRLSNTLFIHLKRFEMNYETGMPKKLNDYFSFPTELDLYPFSHDAFLAETQAGTQAGAQPDARGREYYQYELTGIVVHTGTLESGHYYSFIRERGPRAYQKAVERARALGQPLPRPDAGVDVHDPAFKWSGRWMEFNDSHVSEFDAKNIAEHCFGGTTTTTQYSTTLKKYVSTDVPMVKNAYMLVYERKLPQPVDLSVGVRASEDGGASAADARGTCMPHELVPLDASGRGVLPGSVADAVAVDNRGLALSCRVLDAQLAVFMHSVADTVLRHPLLWREPSVQSVPAKVLTGDATIVQLAQRAARW
ncbi:MAG: hypothetical protein EOO41_02140, partial [Methanobacteriota archaeon]